jgi:23S rRNA (adenine-N6)-dimethyltransferase
VPAGGNVRWGWHRLDDRWAARLVADAGVDRGDLVLDVGAGDGAVTAALIAAGATVVAVELHPRRCALLRRRFADARVTVVHADAASLRLPRRPFRAVSNPPYAITTPLLRRLLAPGSALVGADLVLQRAAARRWAGGDAPGAGRWAREFDVHLGRSVPRRAFDPPPPVDSATLIVRRRGTGDGWRGTTGGRRAAVSRRG